MFDVTHTWKEEFIKRNVHYRETLLKREAFKWNWWDKG